MTVKNAPVNGSIRVTNADDYLSRRVRKLSEEYNGSSWVQQGDRRFLYHGWRLIAELEGSTLLGTYVWAEAEASAVGAAEGQGALVAVQQAGVTYAPVYDGRGNITGWVNTATKTLVAARRFDPYGQRTDAVLSGDPGIPLGFKGQYTDTETGLVYYSHRFYHPKLGRLFRFQPAAGPVLSRSKIARNISRDPLGYAAGHNLYRFAANDPANQGDFLGLASVRWFWFEYSLISTEATGGGISFSFGNTFTNSADSPGSDGTIGASLSLIASFTPPARKFIETETLRMAKTQFRAFGSPEDGKGWVQGKQRPGDDVLRVAMQTSGEVKTDPQAGNSVSIWVRDVVVQRPENPKAVSIEQDIRIRLEVTDRKIRVVVSFGTLNEDAHRATPQYLALIATLNGKFQIRMKDGTTRDLVFVADIRPWRDWERSIQRGEIQKGDRLELRRFPERSGSASRQWNQLWRAVHEFLHTVGAVDEYLGPMTVESNEITWRIEGGREGNVMMNDGNPSQVDLENLRYLNHVLRRTLGGTIEEVTAP